LHPDGGFKGEGTSPFKMILSFFFTEMSATGIADSKAFV
jgi:hypothetical protein